ncbi:MAG: hypothetical protein WCK28_15965 [Burkholderiales bacterium]
MRSASAPRRADIAAAAVATAFAAAALSSAAHAQPTGGATFAPTSAVVAIVKVPKPWYAPRALVTSKMRDTIPQYDSIPGLAFKAYSFAQADGAFGGVYLWKDLGSARAFYGPAWFERVERERGVKGEVRFLEVPVAVDAVAGGTPLDANSPSVATLVLAPAPVGADRARLVKDFEAAIPADRQVPGLLRKYDVLADDGRYGALYLWKDAASARQGLADGGAARGGRAGEAGGVTVEWFDTPILLPTRLAGNVPAVPGL